MKHSGVVLGIFVIFAIILTIIVFRPHREFVVNEGQLTMKDFLLDRKVVMKITTAEDKIKAETVYRFVIISDRELKRFTEKDGIWIAHRGLRHYLFTQIDPRRPDAIKMAKK